MLAKKTISILTSRRYSDEEGDTETKRRKRDGERRGDRKRIGTNYLENMLVKYSILILLVKLTKSCQLIEVLYIINN